MTDATDYDLFVVFKLASYVAWLDPATLEARHSLQLPTNCHELVVDDQRRRCYVSIYGNGIYGNNTQAGHAVAVIDLDTRALLDIVDLGNHRGPHGLALGQGGLVWVSCDRSGTVVAIDPATLTLTAAIQLDSWATPHWIVTAPDGRTAYTANKATDHLSVVDLVHRTVSAVIPSPQGGEGLDLTSDGSRLYFGDHSGAGLPSATTHPPQLHAVSTRTATLETSVPLDFPPLDAAADHELRVRVTPGDHTVVISGYHWDRVVIADAGDLRKQTAFDVPGGPMGFAFPPPGSSLPCLVTSHDAGKITALDLSDGRVLDVRQPSGVPSDGPETLQYIRRTT
jgi:DNA-binding beta-propeller fold protein YncE